MSDPIGAYFDHAQLSMAAYANLTPGMTNDDCKPGLENAGFSGAHGPTGVIA